MGGNESMVDWNKIKDAYELVAKGVVSKAEVPGAKIYSMGDNNPVARIDIKKEGKK
jgi:hypothetical protein